MKYRYALPQLNGRRMLTDGGLETTLSFKDGIDLPLFAAFMALETEEGLEALDLYMRKFADLALRDSCGFIMDTPTWRASPRWAAELNVSLDRLKDLHRRAIDRLCSLRTGLETSSSPFVLNGVVGPQSDGYAPTEILSVDEAHDYHGTQIQWFADMGVDMVSAITMTYADEAIGFTRAAADANVPAIVSFTVETDGRLPSGQALGAAVEQVDEVTRHSPAYFMINCAHPDHFRTVLEQGSDWTLRIGGVRANASRLSHAELDEAEELDEGNPEEFGRLHRDLLPLLPNLCVFGGCCGTDHRHIDQISRATAARCQPRLRTAATADLTPF